MGMDLYVYEVDPDGDDGVEVYDTWETTEDFDDLDGEHFVERHLDFVSLWYVYGERVEEIFPTDIDGLPAWFVRIGEMEKLILERFIPTVRVTGRRIMLREIDWVGVGLDYDARDCLWDYPCYSRNTEVFEALTNGFIMDEEKIQRVKDLVEKYENDDRKLIFYMSW